MSSRKARRSQPSGEVVPIRRYHSPDMFIRAVPAWLRVSARIKASTLGFTSWSEAARRMMYAFCKGELDHLIRPTYEPMTPAALPKWLRSHPDAAAEEDGPHRVGCAIPSVETEEQLA